MSWSLDATSAVWKCTEYDDLQYAEVNNLAEYGQPFSPYERGFVHNFTPDFKKIIVEMPQEAVMGKGYGEKINYYSFPVVRRFLSGGLLPVGRYSFTDLVKKGFATSAERVIKTNLYGDRTYDISAGSIAKTDAAYIHGTVGFALKAGTTFEVSNAARTITGEIGALDDNWDFNSSSGVINFLNVFVAALAGPDHNNLEAPIQLRFRGSGKFFRVSERVPAVMRFINKLIMGD